MIFLCLPFVLKLKPGLSFYEKDPRAAADSLRSLLDKAESVVPLDLRSKTPVKVGVSALDILMSLKLWGLSEVMFLFLLQATAGLRALEGDASDRILESVIL